MARIEKHGQPFPHIVMSPQLFEQLKEVEDARTGEKVRLFGLGVGGGLFSGLPVYTDECPCRPLSNLDEDQRGKNEARLEALERAWLLISVGWFGIDVLMATGSHTWSWPLPLTVWGMTTWLRRRS